MSYQQNQSTCTDQGKVINYLSYDGVSLDSEKESSLSERFFEFKPKQEDYILSYKISWDVITSDVYHLQIGNRVFGVPSTFYVMIGDSYGEIDWIQIDELIGREIECVTLDKNLESWMLYEPKLVDVTKEVFHWPMSSEIIPSVSGSKVILVSSRDQHYCTKDFLIDSFLTSI